MPDQAPQTADPWTDLNPVPVPEGGGNTLPPSPPAASSAAPDPWADLKPVSVMDPPAVPDQPGTVWDTIKGMPGALVRGLTAGASTLGTAASLEESNPEQAEQMPSPEEAQKIVEQNVTGPLYESKTAPGRAVSAGLEAIAANPPAAVMGPGGVGKALMGAFASGVGSQEAGEAAQSLAPDHPGIQTAAEIAGGIATPMVAETAANTARALRVPAKPDINQQFGVTQTPGEITGDLGLRQREASAMRDLSDPRAQAFVAQRQQEMAAAPEVAAGQMGLNEGVDNPAQAADIVSNELVEQKRSNEVAIQQQGATLAKNITNFKDKLSPTGNLEAENPMEAANIIQGAVANEAERAQAATDAAYANFERLPGSFYPSTFNNIDRYIQRRVTSGPDPAIINPQTTPITSAAIADLNDVTNPIKQDRDPATGRILPRENPLTPQVVETARKRLNTFYGAALQAAQGPARNFTDLRAMRGVMNAFDDFVSGRLRAGTYVGGDPTAVTDALDAARGAHSNFRKTFTPQGTGDVVGPAIQKILGRHEGQAATPEEIQNLLYGKGGTPVKIGQRLIRMFGAASPEIGAIKQGYVASVMHRPPGLPEYTPNQIAGRIRSATSSTLARTYFSPAELAEWNGIADQLDNFHNSAFPDLDPVEKNFLDITGDQNTNRAGSIDTRRTLFEDVMKGDRNSEEMQARLKQRLSPRGFGVYQKGLFLHAVSPVEGVPNWGPAKVAKRVAQLLDATRNTNTYTAGQRALIKSYGDFMQSLAMPARGFAPSEPAIMRLGSTIASRIGGVVGAMIGHSVSPFPLMGELAGYTAGKQAERLAESHLNRVSKQLPIVADQMAKYQRSLSVYKNARSTGTQKLMVGALSNLNRSLSRLGIDPSSIPQLNPNQ